MRAASDTEKKYYHLQCLFQDGMAGNAQAYEQFLHDITRILRRMVSRALKGEDREDVIQEILISLHKARHTYDGERPILPWIAAIAQYRINDYLRKHYASARHEMIDIEDLQITDVTELPSTHESLEEILYSVPEREKQILTMMYVEGYTAKETGERLNMQVSAVKVAARRAAQKLRKTLRYGND
ncbi:MAG: RNA polymerase subunit sigma-24 [Rickettsiales bacterium]|nr:RNA polymerase subunit sigma-24 [Rickettsiales bacterium]|tara:strand:+ start:2055 stop:2609 length:555 start_codon:yes stop_codon:yes gene_type:complete